jgi:uncharacterized alkaline shock family protein YloU
MLDEGRLSGDVPMQPSESAEGAGALLADEVIATYVADAVRGIKGIAQLHGSAMQVLSERVHVGVPAKGVVVRRLTPRTVETDVHVKVAWGAVIPQLAREVQEQVAKRVESLLDLEVRNVTLFVDEIEAPGEA